jgi:hypothetical protein
MVSVFMVNLLKEKGIGLGKVASNLSARVSLMHGLCQFYSRFLIKLEEACCVRLSRGGARLAVAHRGISEISG